LDKEATDTPFITVLICHREDWEAGNLWLVLWDRTFNFCWDPHTDIDVLSPYGSLFTFPFDYRITTFTLYAGQSRVGSCTTVWSPTFSKCFLCNFYIPHYTDFHLLLI